MALTRIRVGVQVARPAVSVQIPVAGSGVRVPAEQAKVKAFWTFPVAALSYIQIQAEAAVDYIGYNPVLKTPTFVIDTSSAAFHKMVDDGLLTDDGIDTVHFDKARQDIVLAVDVKGFYLERSFADEVDATDDLYGLANIDDEQTMFLAKSLPIDGVTTGDVDSLLVGKNLSDVTATDDHVDSFDMTKARTDDTTVSDVKGFSLERSIADTVDAGDEMNSLFSTDDGEVMLFNKSLAPDSASTGDDIDTVHFGKRSLDDAVTGDAATRDSSKALADVPRTTDYRVSDLQKAAEGDFALTGDQHTSFTEKPLEDAFLSTDEAVSLVGKAVEDQFAVADQLQPFDLGKSAEDVAATGDAIDKFDTSKALADDAYMADQYMADLSRIVGDIANMQTEGPNLWENYVEAGYFAAEYVGDGIPAFDVSKLRNDSVGTSESWAYAAEYLRHLTDSVGVTDDFFGATNVDDDQTMLVVKALNDTPSTSEIKTFAVGVTKEDAAQFADSLATVFGKPAVDAFIAGDTQTKGTGKALTESSIALDAIDSRAIGKALSDTATKSDTAAISLLRGRSEAITVGDTSSRLAGKGLADPASTGDSGSLRMTDFCDVLYFTDVYVGTSRTF